MLLLVVCVWCFLCLCCLCLLFLFLFALLVLGLFCFWFTKQQATLKLFSFLLFVFAVCGVWCCGSRFCSLDLEPLAGCWGYLQGLLAGCRLVCLEPELWLRV